MLFYLDRCILKLGVWFRFSSENKLGSVKAADVTEQDSSGWPAHQEVQVLQRIPSPITFCDLIAVSGANVKLLYHILFVLIKTLSYSTHHLNTSVVIFL